MNESKFPETVAFCKRANWFLRIALLYAVLWPLGALGIALYLTAYNIQTIITWFEYSLLILVFLFLLGAPYEYFLHSQDPDAKVALRWAGILVAVELSIGFYFAAIPVSNDPALVPYLIFAATIIFILNFTKTAHWAVLLLSLVIIGITIVFVCGGRPQFKEFYVQVLNPPNTPRNSSAANISAPFPIPPPQTVSAQPPGSLPQIAQRPAPPPPPPNPFLPDWAQGQRVLAGDLTVEAAPCIIRATNLHCFFRITNQNDQDEMVDVNGYAGPVRAIDDQGKEYLAKTVAIGTRSGNEIQPTLPAGAPILGYAIFEDFTGQSVALIEIGIHQFAKGPNLNFKIRDIGVQHQGER